ncbi:sensor histidine kinase [Actinomyces capricornis]|uniref:Two-component sensor histidine kinase n=1 Tax=Actinomyces capricornis TaxID=2755559 RepID=A0ABN6K4W3_9ACTO|nr:ATP-binding protein [Actinomyces capricornis]BDA64697.1 two-component sensor histidine kinase [Actinomyces capricornis]
MEPAGPTTPRTPATGRVRGGLRPGPGQPPAAVPAPRIRALLDRLGLPRWAWRLLAWGLTALTLVLLWWHTGAFVLFFAVYPLLWLAHDAFRRGVGATVLFGLGIAVVGSAAHDASWLATALISTGFSLLMGMWVRGVHVARAQAVQALADKQEALEALLAAQEGLAAAERAAGIAAERERWAREVHDTLAQGFVSVITLAQAAQAAQVEAALPGDPGAAASESAPGEERRRRETGERLRQIEEIARENLAEARALVAGQGPRALQDSGLAAALERLAADQRRHGLEVALTTSLPEDLPVARQVAVLRTVQEALSNIVRHADATTAQVSTGVEDGEIVIAVSDDGRGTRGAPEGTGLSGMRARLESLGGTLTVDPLHAPDAQGCTGTVLEARMGL